MKAPLQRGVFFHVFAVLIERGRPDGPQFPSRKLRLEHVGRVHRPLARPGPHDRVELINEEDDLALGVGDLLEKGFEAILKFAPEFGSGNH